MEPDWLQLTVSPWELFVRGSVVYLALVATIRFVLRRDVGSMSMADVLFIVLVADASQNAMSGDYRSIADGAVLVGTLAFWNVVLDWLSFRNSLVRRIVEPPPLLLIQNGRWIRSNLKREWITTDEVLSQLRENGIDDIAEVQRAYLEPSGELGIIKANSDQSPRPRHRKGPR